jgi:hypothetical protein
VIVHAPRSQLNRVSQRWTLLVSVLLPLSGMACAASASAVPLADAEPAGFDVYYYGNAAPGGKELPTDGNEPAALQAKRKEAEARASTAKAASSAAANSAVENSDKEKAEKEKAAKADTPGADAKPTTALPPLDWAGSYRGTDTVTIRLDDVPERVETDEKAKLVVEAGGDAGKFVFKIVDSQNGGDLCSVKGHVNEQQVEFEAGQTCLNQILGVEMKATLTGGNATLAGKTLSVNFAIAVEFETSDDTFRGVIDYHFEGQRE